MWSLQNRILEFLKNSELNFRLEKISRLQNLDQPKVEPFRVSALSSLKSSQTNNTATSSSTSQSRPFSPWLLSMLFHQPRMNRLEIIKNQKEDWKPSVIVVCLVPNNRSRYQSALWINFIFFFASSAAGRVAEGERTWSQTKEPSPLPFAWGGKQEESLSAVRPLSWPETRNEKKDNNENTLYTHFTSFSLANFIVCCIHPSVHPPTPESPFGGYFTYKIK